MRAAIDVWKRAFGVAWANLTGIITLNLLWLVSSWLVVTVGPATLTAYWWAAHVMREEKEERPGSFFRALKRFFWKGLGWSLAWVVLLGLAWTNLVVYGHWLPPFALSVVQFFWIYALIFALAMQPYVLEMLTMEERPFFESVKRSAWQVLANPIYSHAHLLILAIAGFLAWRTTTLVAILLVALIMIWWAVTAGDVPWRYGEKRKNEANIEDVL